ncbi:hypothetical protein P43SY_003839 [Pythium insidiosum]|uniref:Short chain dehydrogenase n=1 Tax=Pythium insidiosum TaxID=114742 RepID=A0AAD5LDU8_PYTIN|nr:hypothetical protein P43SY_003839 [Pythium insidiosum]
MTTKTVLITGATRGIGLTFVKHYKQSGWRVLAGARDPSQADHLRALAPDVIVPLDVASEASIQQAADALRGEHIDVLVNNAGVLERETLDSTRKADVLRQFEVNAVGPFLVTRAFLPQLQVTAWSCGIAKVVHLSSVLGSIQENASGGMYGYRAAKAALNAINKSLSVDLRDDGIATIVLHPGYVATDMNGYKGVVAQDASVAGLVARIDEATMAHSGRFFDYEGRERPW